MIELTDDQGAEVVGARGEIPADHELIPLADWDLQPISGPHPGPVHAPPALRHVPSRHISVAALNTWMDAHPTKPEVQACFTTR